MLDFPDAVAKLCISKYNSLKKTGKPAANEWTVLAGIILTNATEGLSLVSLATGTKCLGSTELMNSNFCEAGDRLSDSHAEILARRAFLRYLYDQIDLLLSTKDSDVFTMNANDRIEIKLGVSFHFYCSQSPCGDCSIIPMNEEETFDASRSTKKRKVEAKNEVGENGTVLDIHRTGAKCLVTESKKDLRLAGANYHVTGPLRTKPGRGDPTISLSCSDKIAKWNAIGIQGSFLSLFVPMLRLESIVVGGECPFSWNSMERGIYKRFGDGIAGLNILQATVPFLHKRSEERSHPCPSSIVWCDVRNRNTEVAVEGRKQGATKNKKGTGLLVSRRSLLKTFLKTLDNYSPVKSIPTHPKKIYYRDYKQWCDSYQQRWKSLKLSTFTTWPDKPTSLQNFSL